MFSSITLAPASASRATRGTGRNISCYNPQVEGFDLERTTDVAKGQVTFQGFGISGRGSTTSYGFRVNSTYSGKTPADIFCSACAADNIGGGDVFYFHHVGNIQFSNGWGYSSAPGTSDYAVLHVNGITNFVWLGGQLESSYVNLLLDGGVYSTRIIGTDMAGTTTNIPDTGTTYNLSQFQIIAPRMVASTPYSSTTAELLDGSLRSPAVTTVANLPAASKSNRGKWYEVTDSTPISTEGQPCAGNASTFGKAFSDGTQWKCF